MVTSLNQSCNNKTEDGYPLLRIGSADVILLGSWHGLSNALLSLHKNKLFMAQYNSNHTLIETYTILDGSVEMEHEGVRRLLHIGESVDASYYKQAITFYGKTDAEILIKMEANFYESLFYEMQILQVQADEIAALDGYTYDHCNRIKDYSVAVWKRLERPQESLRILRWGAYFHDIGKRAISLDILNKPGKLTDDEWRIMKSHTTQGAKIMRDHPIEWLKEAAFIVEQHHERYDGNGYPYGLKGNEIAIEASIVSVVDAFDAMTTDRVYQKAFTIQKALQELKDGKGTQFNPEIVDIFIGILEEDHFRWR